MTSDFGLLVDFLRGELDESSAAKVRQRLENEEALFEQCMRLRRTYAVLRSMPGVSTAEHPGVSLTEKVAGPGDTPAGEIPLTEPREAFVRDLRREYAARAWAGLIPRIEASPGFVQRLRVEWFARAVAASLPWIEARPEWVAELREEFGVRALTGSVSSLDVSESFERRLKVALVETEGGAETDEAPQIALPEVHASDPFRRRLFKNVMLNSRRRVREEPRRVDIREYELGREFRRGLKGSRRSVGFTLAVHTLAIAIMLFVFVDNSRGGSANPYVGVGEREQVIPLPDTPVDDFEFVSRDDGAKFTFPSEEGWAPDGEDATVGLDATAVPEHREIKVDEDEEAPERRSDRDDGIAYDNMREDVAGFFRLRSDSRAKKIDYLGSEKLYEALDKSLAWLRDRQHSDGYWGHVGVDPAFVSQGERLLVKRLEMTSAALLAFLGDGHSSEDSPLGYDTTVRNGIRWLITHQDESGRIGPPGLNNVLVHAMATLVLAEEFGMTRAHWLRKPLRKASRWLCEVRAEGSDGFPFGLGQSASLTTSVWAYMALATARHVRVPPVDLPQQRIDEFLIWFNKRTRGTMLIEDTAPAVARTELLPKAASSALSLFAVEAGWRDHGPALLRQVNRELPDLKSGLVPLDQRPDSDRADVRYLFFGSLAQALNLQRNGEKSNEWYLRFTETVLQTQNDDGSFDSSSDYNDLYGKVLSTSLVSLSIENAYRVSILNE